jgi:uncharacterized protein (TIRG00374 family)
MTRPKKNPVRSPIGNALLVGVAFGLLGLAVYRNRAELRDVLSRPIDPRLFLLAFGFFLAAINASFVRWYLLVRVIEPRFTLRAAVLLGFIGNVFNLVIPGAVGGDFVKAAYLVRMDINRTQAVASMVIDRILGLLGLFVLAGVAGLVAWPLASKDVKVLIVLVWLGVATGLLVLAAIFNQSLTTRFPTLLEGHGRVAGILRELKVMSATYRQRLGLVAGMLGLSMCVHFLLVVAFYIVSLAIFRDSTPSFAKHLLMVPLTLFTTAVPIPFGALGVSEFISQQLFQMVNHPGGLVAMMAFRILMYAGGLVSAAVYAANLKKVRSLTDTAVELEEELIDGELDSPHPNRVEAAPGSDPNVDLLPVHPVRDEPEDQ